MRDDVQGYKTILTEKVGRVLTITLNRPKALNALNSQVLEEVLDCASIHDTDPDIGCMVFTGNARAFAAGADIAELNVQDYGSMYETAFFAGWDRFASLRTPKVAAVSGYALGGGCELAMMCDVILASETARFGQPEVKIGCIPGIGGTQRLTKLVGRACAMDMILTGRMIDAPEAQAIGLVSRVVPEEDLHSTAQEVAATIASYPKDIVMMARACVNEAEEVGLNAGLRFERQMYHALYGLPAQREGMTAFLEKRPPKFR
ncbi:enoyl-CoA hydratase-related protein [Shimia sp. R9_3]|uniref:enoyl-CoA hydratase-related protein n=1 Tax=Shimia sp. R9_3 TaxID=2821113 RepID=UPI001ADAE87D|nr:enoyl-CoA hydratase-related protein [Shimia sp. R9_3]MBO9401020.1 enoyl-CoA hydratase/isomerase family protein [Shimia sp. R9_3]